VVENLEKAIAVCPTEEHLYIIGGGEIYSQSIHLADQLDITRVHHSFDADVYFPEIDPEIWELTSEIFNSKDEKHLFDYTFQTFIRRK
jgi:dihydrofolate reductase